MSEELEAIVKALAANDVNAIEEGYFFCGLCHQVGSLGDLYRLEHHEPDCLWRRAKTLYPDVQD